jgi:hypothetical protein
MPKKHPYSTPNREQHPVGTTKTWPAEVTKAPQKLPGQGSAKK